MSAFRGQREMYAAIDELPPPVTERIDASSVVARLAARGYDLPDVVAIVGEFKDDGWRPADATAETDLRNAAVNHAIYALGDSALTHDGFLRPRVWELADQIAAYIRTGDRP